MIAATDFRIQELRLLGHRDPRVRYEKRRGRQACYQLLARAAQVPFLREAVCSRVCALLEKRAGSDDPRVRGGSVTNETTAAAPLHLPAGAERWPLSSCTFLGPVARR